MFVEEMLSWNLATATFKSFIRPTMRQSPSLLGRAVSFLTGRVVLRAKFAVRAIWLRESRGSNPYSPTNGGVAQYRKSIWLRAE